jgi:CBS domain-containing protein
MPLDRSKLREIVEISVFIVLAFVIVYLFELRNESLLLIALIFGVYLLVSGKVRQLKFMDLEVIVSEVESKQFELKGVDSMQAELDTEIIEKWGPEQLENDIKPKLIREAKKIKVLSISKKHVGHYNPRVAYAYLKYFTHVVFVDENNLLSGFAEADDLLKIIKPINPLDPDPNSPYDNIAMNFVNNINQWILESPIVNPMDKNVYVREGTSRKQALGLMNQHQLKVLPVVSSLGGYYKGIIDYDSIIWQITRDLYEHTKISR